jgi:hypothetical protein
VTAGTITRRIGALWAQFRRAMLPQVSSVQVKETRRAFYLGAGAMFQLMNQAAKISDDEQASIAMLSDIDAELKEFFDDIGSGDDQN